MYTLIRLLKHLIRFLILLGSFTFIVLVDNSLGIPLLSIQLCIFVLDSYSHVGVQAIALFIAAVFISSVFAVPSLLVLVILSGIWLGILLADTLYGRRARTRFIFALISASLLFWIAGGVLSWSVGFYAIISCALVIFIAKKQRLLPASGGPWYIR